MNMQYEPLWVKQKNVPLCFACGFEAYEQVEVLKKICCRECAEKEYKNLAYVFGHTLKERV